jgi:hypothetical protein
MNRVLVSTDPLPDASLNIDPQIKERRNLGSLNTTRIEYACFTLSSFMSGETDCQHPTSTAERTSNLMR